MIGTKEFMENEKNLKSIIEFYLNGVEKYLDVIQKRVLELVDILNNFFSEKNRFGFRNIDFVSSKEGILKNVTEDLSFLTGSTGVILSMLSVVRGETTFEKHLLIK